jgi:uncharacterized protein (TIGR00251 family)
LRLIDTPWLQIEAEQARILLHVQPGASRSEIVGLHGGALKLRVAAAAINGKANALVCQLIADTLALPHSYVKLSVGAKSRRKTIIITPLDGKTAQKLEEMGKHYDKPS